MRPTLLLTLTLLAAPLSSVRAQTATPTMAAPVLSPALLQNGSLPLTIGPSPVTTEGNVAGRPTDLVLMLPMAGDPSVPGLAFAPGGTITVTLPAGFVRTQNPINVAVPRGWPQADVCCYTAVANGNVVTITFTTPVRTEGVNTPGVKILAHIRGQAYTNPGPGTYTFTAQVVPAPGHPPIPASGSVTIIPSVPLARLAPSNLLLPRGQNANFQVVALNRPAPALLSFMLWRGGQSLNGVGILPADTTRYPGYTGGLLVRDANGDGKLSLTDDEVVGGIIGKAPMGATGQSAASPMTASGTPILSGQLPGYGTTTPVPGLLPVLFTAGSLPGTYQPTFELLGGNSVQATVKVVEP